MTKLNFKTLGQELRTELLARRRDFHMHPELGFEEFRTSGIVAEELTKLGIEVQTGIAKTGVVGVLEGDTDGPTVLVRADMDALPILEQNDMDYASQSPGKMHACGHDAHVAIGLGVANLCSPQPSFAGWSGKIVPAWRRGNGGALAMINDGVLGKSGAGYSSGPPRVDGIANRHCRGCQWACNVGFVDI
ncbi:MAG: M20/M25/M40 family metallo-hydrolase [Anaerolineae bacterium]